MKIAGMNAGLDPVNEIYMNIYIISYGVQKNKKINGFEPFLKLDKDIKDRTIIWQKREIHGG